MKNLWDDTEAAKYGRSDLGQRVFTSRLLGRDPTLVLHGGGNTSVKISERDILGGLREVLYVKGSGWDLATIEPAGFSPVLLDHLRRLVALPELTDAQMSNEMLTHLTVAGGPAPSVEAILHAILPFKFVDHTHADAFISVNNSVDGSRRVREIYGDTVVYVPYVMPGFKLCKLCSELYPTQATGRTVGMVLEHHGLFSFGATAKESYDRMIDLVSAAEDYLQRAKAWQIPYTGGVSADDATSLEARLSLRQRVSEQAGRPMILLRSTDPVTNAFCRRQDLEACASQGPATPDHVIRTKRLPLIGQNLAGYAADYADYFQRNRHRSAGQTLAMLDPAPRVSLDAGSGLTAFGRNAREAAIVREIYEHTAVIINRADALGGWRALPEGDIFDVEYWELEQAKLRKSGKPPIFEGEIALVTGAASGIGKACVDSLLLRGAAVVGLDLNPAVATMHDHLAYFGLPCDLANEAALAAALHQALHHFGGLDMVVLNAGIFPSGCRIEAMDSVLWRRVFEINLHSNLTLLKLAYPALKRAPRGGRVVAIGSKNVRAPGPGASAYSASKAALNQLVRVAALEWGADQIRLNSIHPNAVFDTALWTPEILESRARHYGMSVEDYKTNNLLKVEVKSRDVGELAAELCGPLFAKTTAAQIPIDGGNDRVV